LLYPTGGALATDPVILMGAILGGATFGDNISPVSDTTIASVLTQGADMKSVVRSRLRYALPAAAVALIVCGVLGAADAPREIPGEAYVSAAGVPAAGVSAAGVSAGGAQGPSPSPAGLPMLAVPALVIGMLLRRRHLLEGLLTGIAAAAILGLSLGLLQPSELLHIDAAQFGARGLVVDGLEKGLGVSVFTLLLMGLVATIEAAGVVGRIVEAARRRTHSLPAAEWWTLGTVSAATLLTTHPTVAILMVGDFTRRMGEEFGISPQRRANLLDTMACSWPFLFPWFIPAILASSMTIGAGEFGMPRLTALQVGLANAHSWALLGMMLVAVAFGYGRDRPAGVTVDPKSEQQF
jgi:Na+/H+ antiporter NhaC